MRRPPCLKNQRGATLMVVLLMMVVMGLAAGMAGNTWKNVMEREREAELLFRGDQYRRAIESYYKAVQGGARAAYPVKLEDLLKDPRSLQTRRHLREKYRDPLTNEEFELVREGGGISGLPGAVQSLAGIRGVYSKSSREPFKKAGFREPYEAFNEAATYGDWKFVFVPTQAPARPEAGQPAQPPMGVEAGQPRQPSLRPGSSR
jgi:type II secretory pathway pseudopilin PulG